LQRYFIKTEQFRDQHVYLDGDEARHITRVMRMSVGDKIICASNMRSALCKIEAVTDKLVTASVLEWLNECSELPNHVTIAQGMPKGDKLELIVQKGTELGAARFLPFYSSRSIVKWTPEKAEKKAERLSKIAKEAAEQSHRQSVPTVSTPVSFDVLCSESKNFDIKIVAYEAADDTQRHTLPKLLHRLEKGRTILFAVGPEGGFTEEEIEMLKRHDFHVCSLGPRILRTETAALYFLSVLSYETELMR